MNRRTQRVFIAAALSCAIGCTTNVAPLVDGSSNGGPTEPTPDLAPSDLAPTAGDMGCTLASLRCNGQQPQICTAGGTWSDVGGACVAHACIDGKCVGVCSPGTTQCSGNAVQTCDATGSWGAAMSCTGQTCIGGSCTGECAAGAARCSGNAVQTCDASGTWTDAVACAGQSCVDGACVGDCQPNTTRCSGIDIETCDASGQWSAPTACAPTDGDLCQDDRCQFCPDGQTACSSACTDTSSDVSNCGTCGNVCGPYANATAICQAPSCGFTCDSGFLDCDGDAATGCEIDGTSDRAHCGACDAACAANQTCSNGSCACDPSYTPDASKGVFVSTSGSDSNAGTLASPVRTIAKGIAAAQAASLPNVYVAEGTYNEALTITDSPVGVSVQAGWLAGSFQQDCGSLVNSKTYLRGTTYAVKAVDVLHRTGFSHMTIETSLYAPTTSPNTDGSSQIAIFVSGADSQFFLNDVFVESGYGGMGGLVAAGGNGSGSNCSGPADGATGTTGAAGSSAGLQGTFGSSGFVPRAGGNGGAGTSGDVGVTGQQYCTTYATCAGGGCDVQTTTGTATVCAAGGWGGCGAAGGNGGLAGRGGGASVALLVYGAGATVSIIASTLLSSAGGAASPGGSGGAGATGDSGQSGYCSYYAPTYPSTSSYDCTHCDYGLAGCGDYNACYQGFGSSICGGYGGFGGNGGKGGNGGTGAGGPSYAVVRGSDAIVSVDTGSSLRFSAGGSGSPTGGSGATLGVP